MNQTDYKKFIEIIGTLSEYYGKEKSKSVISLYWDSLKYLSIEKFENKANEHIRINNFFPTIAYFLEVPSKDNQGILAWQKVLYAFRVVGCWRSVQFDDTVIHSAIEMLGGWRRFNEMTIEERKWAEKDFYKYYNAMQTKSEHPKYLVGYSEKEQDDGGYFNLIKPPTRVFSDDVGNIKIEGQEEMKKLGENKPQEKGEELEKINMPENVRNILNKFIGEK